MPSHSPAFSFPHVHKNYIYVVLPVHFLSRQFNCRTAIFCPHKLLYPQSSEYLLQVLVKSLSSIIDIYPPVSFSLKSTLISTLFSFFLFLKQAFLVKFSAAILIPVYFLFSTLLTSNVVWNIICLIACIRRLSPG